MLDEAEAPGMEGVPSLLDTVRAFLLRYLKPEAQVWLARMSLWRDFTEEQAGVTRVVLRGRVELSILQQAADGRYSMHALVREAAADLLKELAPQEQDAARMGLVRAMVAVGAELERLVEGGARAQASAAALKELPNCLGFCQVPEGLVREEGVTGVARLGEALLELGYFDAAAAVLLQVDRPQVHARVRNGMSRLPDWWLRAHAAAHGL